MYELTKHSNKIEIKSLALKINVNNSKVPYLKKICTYGTVLRLRNSHAFFRFDCPIAAYAGALSSSGIRLCSVLTKNTRF